MLRLTLAASLALTAPAAPSGKSVMIEHTAKGSFDVKLTPIGTTGSPVGAMTIAKTFHGDLDATSTGQMLAVRTATEGSAGYVAMEQVTGTLAGHDGSFALQHSGSMNRGSATLSVTVVPDSGTGKLAGLTGTMDIQVSPGRHDYVFRYALPR